MSAEVIYSGLLIIILFASAFLNFSFFTAYIVPFLPTAGILIAGVFGWKKIQAQLKSDRQNINHQFHLNRLSQHSKQLLPTLLQILEDLWSLHEAFLFRGRYCPSIEHRAPNLSPQDGDENSMSISYAQRSHTFHNIGYRLIRNTRMIIFLTKDEKITGTIQLCKSIRRLLMNQKKGRKSHLDYMLVSLGSYLDERQSRARDDSEVLDNFSKSLLELRNQLETQIENEFPTFTDIEGLK